MGFSGCDTRHDKKILTKYSSGAMAIKRVLSCLVHHALYGSTSHLAKIWLVLDLWLKGVSAAMVARLARFFLSCHIEEY